MVQEKRKLPRFHITPCQFHEKKNGRNFSVQDISLGGLSIRLVDRADLPEFAVGSRHAGVVKLDGLKNECNFQVRFIRGTLIGAEWENPSAELSKHLEMISHPEALSLGMKQFDLPEVSAVTWFHHPVGIDLLFYPPNGDSASSSQVGRWIAYIHQNYVQWELDSGLHTGKTMAEDEEGYAHGIVRLETRLLEQDEKLNVLLLRWLESLVEKTNIISSELRNLVLSHLKGIS